MSENQVVKAIKEVIKKDYKDCLSGTFEFENGSCKMEERGGVYGMAVNLSGMTTEEMESFFNRLEGNKIKFKDWKTIGEGYYPLYWGYDINLGFRLFEHIKNSKTVASVQLNTRGELFDKRVIYGAVLCNNRKDNEKELRKEYPDVYHTKIDK